MRGKKEKDKKLNSGRKQGKRESMLIKGTARIAYDGGDRKEQLD